jgi:type IV fimbrial biogenesis protein FimT
MRASTNETKQLRPSKHGSVLTRRAVTIVELVIVVMLIGIMAAVAAPTFYDALLYHRVESAARRVKADLELARNTACLKSKAQSVKFGIADYSLEGVSALDNADQTYTVNLIDDPYELDNVVANFANSQTVTFDGYGTPLSGGTVLLGLRGHRCTVTLDGVTGEVTITSTHDRSNQAVATPVVDTGG